MCFFLDGYTLLYIVHCLEVFISDWINWHDMIIVELGGIQNEYTTEVEGFKHFLSVWIIYTMCDMLWPGSDGLVSLSRCHIPHNMLIGNF